MLTLEQIAIEENKQELEHDLVSLIGLNLCDGLCAYVFENPVITVDNILSATKKLSTLDPHRLVHYFWGDRTSCQLADRKLNLVTHLSDFYTHLIEHSIFPTDEEHKCILLTKGELNAFKKSKSLGGVQTLSSSKTITSSDLSSNVPSLASTRKDLDSSLDSTHMNYSSPLENCDISSSISSSFASKDDLASFSSSAKINFDPLIFEKNVSAAICYIDLVNSSYMKSPFMTKILKTPILALSLILLS